MTHPNPAVNDPAPETPIESGTTHLRRDGVFRELKTYIFSPFDHGTPETFHRLLIEVGGAKITFLVKENTALRLLPHVGASVRVQVEIPIAPEEDEGAL